MLCRVARRTAGKVYQCGPTVSRLTAHFSSTYSGERPLLTSMADAAPEASGAVLTGSFDSYGGVIVDAASLPHDPTAFPAILQRSLEEWRAQGKRGIWLKVPVAHIALVPHAVQHAQFHLHHAEQDYVMLTHWIPETPCTLPPNASHQVGVGAVVLNGRREVLAVQERNGPLKGMNVWKMPTGLVGAGEDIAEAAEREVLEETGVVAQFEGVLAVRQAHGFMFNKSDLFFVAALRLPEGRDSSGGEVRPQESEIAAAAWLPIEQYAAQPFLRAQPLHSQILDTCLGYMEGRVRPMSAASFVAGRKQERRDLLMWCPPDSAAANGAAAAADGTAATAAADTVTTAEGAGPGAAAGAAAGKL